MVKLWGSGSSSANSQPPPPLPQPENQKPSALVSFIKTGKPSWSPGESAPASPTTPGLFIKKNRKQPSVTYLPESGGNGIGNGNQSRRSGFLASPPISPMQSTGPVTPPSRKPVPSSIPPVTSPVAGPSSPSITLPAPLPPRNSVPSEWKRTSGLLNVRDDLLMSLLTSEAVVDSRECEILSGEEVEELKNEHQVLKTRLASAQKKLKLETKLRDAALSLSKLGTAHSKLTKPIDDQLQVAESRLNVAQTELRRVSERASEVERKLLEHRAGVLGYSIVKMEKNTMPSEDLSGACTTNRTSALSSVTTTSAASTARFDGAHLFAGHADAQFPKAPPTVADIVSLEDKLRSATEALSAANQNIAVLKAELEEAKEQWGAEKAAMEEGTLAEVGPLREELDNAKRHLEVEKAVIQENKLTELDALRDELENAREDWEVEKVVMEEKLAGLDALRDELENAREDWKGERVVMEEKLAGLDTLQNELEDARAGGEARAELDEAMDALRMMVQLHGIEAPPDPSLQILLSSIQSHLEKLSSALQEHSHMHAHLEDELQVHVEKNETLSKDLDAVRRERDSAQLEIISLESRVKEVADAGSSANNTPPVEYKGEVADIIALLQPIWYILPAPELRAAKLSNMRHLRNISGTSTPGTSPTKSALPSLSDMDVRGLKSLYDVRSQSVTPSAEQSTFPFTVEAFVARVEALVADDRALIERLIRLAQAHDLLKENAARAQKLVQGSSAALETYQRQVTTLEGQNMSLASTQNALMDEIRELQDAVERAMVEKREMEMHAADQAEMCRQLTEANNALSAKMLTLAEEAAAAPEQVRRQLEAQLAECAEALRQAKEEIEAMHTSEQTQRIVLLDELNSMQTENGNLRAQLRAVKK